MHSDLIGKIAKAQQYAAEPGRVILDGLQATFRGGNSDHHITFADGEWSCDCSTFHLWHTCAHTMALQKLLDPMLPVAARASDAESSDAMMHSGLYGKIEKARYYANEPERVTLNTIGLHFRGGNNDHHITLRDEHWSCDCTFFKTWATCAHVMALQKLFATMLPQAAREIDSLPTNEQMVGALG